MENYKDKMVIVNALSDEEREFLTPNGHGYRDVPEERLLYSYIEYEDKKPLGFIDVYHDKDVNVGNILLAVSPKARGKGIAKKMLSKAIDNVFRKSKDYTLLYIVDADNESSIRLINSIPFSSKYTTYQNGKKFYAYTINFSRR